MSAGVGLLELLAERFYKMTGSGNDFVFVDARRSGAPATVPAEQVAAVCARGTGVGADGLVLLDQPDAGRVRIAYYNRDGSRASLCGNATLCAASLAVHLGAVGAGLEFLIETDAGTLAAGVTPGVGPHFAPPTIHGLQPSVPVPGPGPGAAAERRVGYAVAGVPHLVVEVVDVDTVDIAGRSPALRRATVDRPDGANVNYVSPAGDGRWRMRTFERGVEQETLACGTGAVACAALLRAWGLTESRVDLLSKAGHVLRVTSDSGVSDGRLQGEGRLVFVGALIDAGR